jgi:DNA modification methylase
MPHHLAIEPRSIDGLRPYVRNARTHSKKQIRKIADSIERFGFTNPVLISATGEIICGHGRVAAARLLGMVEVPAVRLSNLSEAERRAYVIADNKLALDAGWNQEMLAIELQGLVELDFDLEFTGFSLAEVDLILDTAADADTAKSDADDAVPARVEVATSRPGDLWQLGRHRLLCGDAREAASYARLLGDEQVDLVFTDPPYNVPTSGHIGGLGKVQHREFVMAAGEMAQPEFIAFLAASLGAMAARCRDGAIAYVCMDWRHMAELLSAGAQAFTELKQLCVWNKTNGGMGSFYRSKHELVFVYKVGSGSHVNSFGLGDTGRYRTNVWDYPGISSIGGNRAEELAMHPTVKPVALVADAIRDCSRRGGVVLDGFAGSGTTLIAAEKTGRRARLVELDPVYCDTILRRFMTVTGQQPVLLPGGASLEVVEAERIGKRGCGPQEVAA